MPKRSTGARRRGHERHRTPRKTPQRSSAKSHAKGTDRRWSSKVKTVSTFPPRDAFTERRGNARQNDGQQEGQSQGLGSAVRMVQFFINRAGKNLPQSRKRELEKAKRILQEMNAKQKGDGRARGRSKARAEK